MLKKLLISKFSKPKREVKVNNEVKKVWDTKLVEIERLMESGEMNINEAVSHLKSYARSNDSSYFN